MRKKWQMIDADSKKIEKIAKKYNISTILATILNNRNIKEDNIEKFLKPTRHDFHNPFLMKDMEKAVERITKAIKDKEKIIIYGDYDVDGITSITVLKSFLEERGLEVAYYIPNRLEEGYGLNIKALDEIIKNKYTLVITVDCGITSIEEIAYAKEKGIDTIVTDHHEVSDAIPEAAAVINPKRKTCKYPCKSLAGVGVVFKLIQALAKEFDLEEKEYLKYLDLVCIGTISDIVPLLDENRTIVKLGMQLLEITKNIGIKAILAQCGYKEINSKTISFGMAPRINACGRMGYAQDGIKLFLTKSESEAIEISNRLGKYNTQRQEMERKIFEEAKDMVNLKEKSIILSSDNWSHGVIGIVASKLVEKYNKPAILVCFEGEMGKGSGRSIFDIDLLGTLKKCSKYIEHYGGHGMAIGITLEKKNFNDFKKCFEKSLENMNIEELVPTIYIDEILTLKEISIDLLKEFKQLEPFGEGNEIPKFLIKDLKIDSIRTLSEGKHLKLTLKNESGIIDAIGFNLGSIANEYRLGDKIDVIANLEINSFRNEEKVQLNIKDVMKSL